MMGAAFYHTTDNSKLKKSIGGHLCAKAWEHSRRCSRPPLPSARGLNGSLREME
jgi:hypothetical protein